MGTQAGFIFATGLAYGTFDTVLAVIESYKEDFESEIKLTVPDLAANLFGDAEAKPHFCNPYEPEIALLTKAMELVEQARQLTIKAITNDVNNYE